MVAARIDFKKIKEEKVMSYLDGWYCPLEMAMKTGFDTISDRKFSGVGSSQLSPPIMLNRIPRLPKQVMAGFN